MKRLTMLVAALAALLGPPAARADDTVSVYGWQVHRTDTSLTDARLNAYVRVADAYWHGTACPAGVQFFAMTISEAPGVVDYPTDIAAVADVGGCRVWFDTPAFQSTPDWRLCMQVVHELGHTHGLQHSDVATPTDPADVMAATVHYDQVPGCPPWPATHDNPAPNGKTRSPRDVRDRSWCRGHAAKCAAKYPRLLAASTRR